MSGGGQLILMVGSNRRNLELLTKVLDGAGYPNRSAPDLATLEDFIKTKKSVSLALLDVSGFGSAVRQHCERLRQADIPFVIIYPRAGPGGQRGGLHSGARGSLTKPLTINRLLGVIRSLVGGDYGPGASAHRAH